jgi:hypothetical protein
MKEFIIEGKQMFSFIGIKMCIYTAGGIEYKRLYPHHFTKVNATITPPLEQCFLTGPKQSKFVYIQRLAL